MEAENCTRSQHDGRAEQASRAYETSAQAGNDSVLWSKCRRSLSWTIEDYELVLEEQRFGYDGSSPTRSAQANQRYDEVNEQYDEIAYHRAIVINVSGMTRLGNPAEICDE